MARFTNKVVMITGGASGIGEATAKAFCVEGAKVVVSDINGEGIGRVVSEITASGGTISGYCGDVSKANDVQDMIQHAVDQYGRLDVLLNNAFFQERGAVADISPGGWNRTFEVTLGGTFLGIKYALPVMLKQGGGVIINTSSAVGLHPDFFLAPYCAAKAGVISLTKSVAMEYSRQGIRCNAICPGGVRTPALIEAYGLDADGKISSSDALLTGAYQRMLDNHAMGRIAETQEIVNATLFLASDEASFMTGTAMVVDGGYTSGQRR